MVMENEPVQPFVPVTVTKYWPGAETVIVSPVAVNPPGPVQVLPGLMGLVAVKVTLVVGLLQSRVPPNRLTVGVIGL